MISQTWVMKTHLCSFNWNFVRAIPRCDAFIGAEVSYDDLKTLDSASDNLKKQSGTFSELAGIYGFEIDGRDRSFQPTSGSIFNFRQTAPLYADKPALDNTLSLSSYKSFSEDLIGTSKIYLRQLIQLVLKMLD